MALADTFANKIGGALSGPVQRSVQRYGGHCTYPFTQCKPPVSTWTARDSSTAIGVCESMSAHWIYYHANDDSLWNWLCPGGQISLAKLQYHIMQLQSAGVLGADQDAITEAWLRSHGILRRMNSYVVTESRQIGGTYLPFVTATGESMGQGGTTRLLNCNDLARAILLDNTGGAGSYKKLGLQGSAGGHTMALWVAQDVVFFDPNFGEFWFESRAAFFNWFTRSFWLKSLYNVGLSGTFDLLPYSSASR